MYKNTTYQDIKAKLSQSQNILRYEFLVQRLLHAFCASTDAWWMVVRVCRLESLDPEFRPCYSVRSLESMDWIGRESDLLFSLLLD